MSRTEKKGRISYSGIELLRKKIDNEAYLLGAIQHIARVMSNEILDIHQGGLVHEQQWKGRK
jgi:hypothetical protein